MLIMTIVTAYQTLRRKIESELSRKRPGPPASSLSQSNLPTNQNSSYPNPAQRSRRQAQKGTVAGLKPSPALTVPENMTVSDASQLCAAKRTDCVLVVDQEEGLSGIFTAKDLAFRVSFSFLSFLSFRLHLLLPPSTVADDYNTDS